MPKSILKPLHEVALLLTLKPGRTPAGKALSAVVLARVEIAMAIESELAK